MRVYIYRAITDKGLKIRNKVEEPSKQTLIKKLRDNGITPIEIIQVAFKGKTQTKKKKNVTNIQEIMKNVNTAEFDKRE